jgi:hypothetical protein
LVNGNVEIEWAFASGTGKLVNALPTLKPMSTVRAWRIYQ